MGGGLGLCLGVGGGSRFCQAVGACPAPSAGLGVLDCVQGPNFISLTSRPAALGTCSTWNTCCSTELTWGLRTPQGTQPSTSVPFITRCDSVCTCVCARSCPCAVLACLSSPAVPSWVRVLCPAVNCSLPGRCAHIRSRGTHARVRSEQLGVNCAHLGFLGQWDTCVSCIPRLLIPLLCI